MPYYAVANGRQTGVFDNWDVCKDQVDGFSHNDYKKFDTPDQAWDFVDNRSERGRCVKQSFDSDVKGLAKYQNPGNNQVAIRSGQREIHSSYQHTDVMDGNSSIIARERHFMTGRDNGGCFVEKHTRTQWQNK